MLFFQPSSSNSSAYIVGSLICYSSQSSSESSASPQVEYRHKCDFKLIGSGKYGQVYEVEYEGKVYAAKQYNADISVEGLSKIFGTIKCIQHENVVSYFNVYNKIDTDKPNIEHAVVFMDKIHSNLPTVIEDKSRDLDLHTTISIFKDIAHGLDFLHGQKIFHCDLIPNNVLLTDNLRAKVSDYGNICVTPIHEACTCHQDSYVCDYLPPEIIAGSPPAASVDVFSCGHMLLYLVLREQPHRLKRAVFIRNGNSLARSELERREDYVNEVGQKYGTHALCSVIKSCLDNDPNKRPDVTSFFSITL